jgi:phage shock protein PspC (stress-responsive transcriptional regulator)
MRRLKRDSKGKVVAGVAAGIGNYIDVDPVIVRIAFVVFTLFNGLGLLLYAAGWFLMPSDKETAAAGSAAEVVEAAQPMRDTQSDGRWIAGLALIVIGALLLADRMPWFHWPHWAHFETLWPLVLVFIGVGLILKTRRTASPNGGAN